MKAYYAPGIARRYSVFPATDLALANSRFTMGTQKAREVSNSSRLRGDPAQGSV